MVTPTASNRAVLQRAGVNNDSSHRIWSRGRQEQIARTLAMAKLGDQRAGRGQNVQANLRWAASLRNTVRNIEREMVAVSNAWAREKALQETVRIRREIDEARGARTPIEKLEAEKSRLLAERNRAKANPLATKIFTERVEEITQRMKDINQEIIQQQGGTLAPSGEVITPALDLDEARRQREAEEEAKRQHQEEERARLEQQKAEDRRQALEKLSEFKDEPDWLAAAIEAGWVTDEVFSAANVTGEQITAATERISARKVQAELDLTFKRLSDLGMAELRTLPSDPDEEGENQAWSIGFPEIKDISPYLEQLYRDAGVDQLTIDEAKGAIVERRQQQEAADAKLAVLVELGNLGFASPTSGDTWEIRLPTSGMISPQLRKLYEAAGVEPEQIDEFIERAAEQSVKDIAADRRLKGLLALEQRRLANPTGAMGSGEWDLAWPEEELVTGELRQEYEAVGIATDAIDQFNAHMRDFLSGVATQEVGEGGIEPTEIHPLQLAALERTVATLDLTLPAQANAVAMGNPITIPEVIRAGVDPTDLLILTYPEEAVREGTVTAAALQVMDQYRVGPIPGSIEAPALQEGEDPGFELPTPADIDPEFGITESSDEGGPLLQATDGYEFGSGGAQYNLHDAVVDLPYATLSAARFLDGQQQSSVGGLMPPARGSNFCTISCSPSLLHWQ